MRASGPQEMNVGSLEGHGARGTAAGVQEELSGPGIGVRVASGPPPALQHGPVPRCPPSESVVEVTGRRQGRHER
ncbi:MULTISPECIES: hypothetical protein [unclassified Streptomyces]|uniref:hypothetical protein n=1 Tax=unclassified Streptomyces TaxID=2593676 RepID=UPI0038142472